MLDDIEELLKTVTRVEVIDHNGRSYTNWEASDVQLSFQDDNQTLKIFMNRTPTKYTERELEMLRQILEERKSD